MWTRRAHDSGKIQPEHVVETKLYWSEQPGCFERHLQRKHGNPLFPRDARTVNQLEVNRARIRDLEELSEFTERITSVLVKLKDALSENTALDEALDAKLAFDELLARAAEIGTPNEDVSSILQLYEQNIQYILASLHSDPDSEKRVRASLAVSEEARRLYNNPFVAQMKRPDTPIKPEELVPSLISESPETIRIMVEVMSKMPGGVGPLQTSASELIRNSAEARAVLQSEPEKLAALGLKAHAANQMR